LDLFAHLESEDQPFPTNIEIPEKAIIGYWENNPNKFGKIVGIQSDFLEIKLFVNGRLVAEYKKPLFHDDFCNCVASCDEWFPASPDAAENFSGKKSNYYYVYNTIETGTFSSIEFDAIEFKPALLSWKTIDFDGMNISHGFEYDAKNSVSNDLYGEIECDLSVNAQVFRL